jgi:hypothetical protein
VIEVLNEAVWQAVEEHALTPAAIEQVIHLSERDDVTEMQSKSAREQKDLTNRIACLVARLRRAPTPPRLLPSSASSKHVRRLSSAKSPRAYLRRHGSERSS